MRATEATAFTVSEGHTALSQVAALKSESAALLCLWIGCNVADMSAQMSAAFERPPSPLKR